MCVCLRVYTIMPKLDRVPIWRIWRARYKRDRVITLTPSALSVTTFRCVYRLSKKKLNFNGIKEFWRKSHFFSPRSFDENRIFPRTFGEIRAFSTILWWSSRFFHNPLMKFALSPLFFNVIRVFSNSITKFAFSHDPLLNLLFSAILWRNSRFFARFFLLNSRSLHIFLTKFESYSRPFDENRVFFAILWRK